MAATSVYQLSVFQLLLNILMLGFPSVRSNCLKKTVYHAADLKARSVLFEGKEGSDVHCLLCLYPRAGFTKNYFLEVTWSMFKVYDDMPDCEKSYIEVSLTRYVCFECNCNLDYLKKVLKGVWVVILFPNGFGLMPVIFRRFLSCCVVSYPQLSLLLVSRRVVPFPALSFLVLPLIVMIALFCLVCLCMSWCISSESVSCPFVYSLPSSYVLTCPLALSSQVSDRIFFALSSGSSS